MNSKSLHRAFPAVVVTAAASLQSGTFTYAYGSNLGADKSYTFKGPLENTRHGPVQVSIVAKGKKIVKIVAAVSPIDDGRSPFLQGRAIPILKQETLTAQSAHIDTVSGATETSDAYIQSLRSAIKKARKARALT